MSTDLRSLQDCVAAWHAREFGTTTPERQALVVAEEAGEVCRAVVKGAQNIRGGSEYWSDELRGEVADVVIAACGLAEAAGFDLSSAVSQRWEGLRHREYAERPIGGTCECGRARSVHRWGVYGAYQDRGHMSDPECSGFRLADPSTVLADRAEGTT